MLKIPNFSSELKNVGDLTQYSETTLLNLHEPQTLWYVDKGYIDLFAHCYQGAQKKLFISTFKKGQIFFGFPSLEDQRGCFTASVEKGCSLKKISFAEFNEANIDQEKTTRYINYWIQLFSDCISFRFRDDIDGSLKPDMEATIPPQVPFVVNQEITWIKIMKGHIALYADQELVIGEDLPEFPIGKKMWGLTVDEVTFKSRTTEEVVAEGKPLLGLQVFEALLLKQIALMNRYSQEMDYRHFEKKRQFDRSILTACLSKMMINLNEKQIIGEGKNVDLVFKACQMVARSMGSSFKMPDQEDVPENAAKYIQLICRNSHVHYRQINLETKWYKKGFLPMVAFLDNPNNPVAVISKKPESFMVYDPQTGRVEKITEAIAKRFMQTAYSFYMPFPDGKLTVKKTFKFMTRGTLRLFIMVLVTGILASMVGVIPSFASNYLFGTVIPDRNIPLLWQLIIGLALSSLSVGAFSITRLFAMTRVVGMMDNRLQSALWDRLLKLPLKFYSQFTSGDLVRRVEAVTIIRQMVTSTVLTVLLSGIFSFIYLFVMVYWSWQLSIIGIVPITLMVILLLVSLHFDVKLLRKMTNLDGKVNGIIVQLIQGITKLKIAGAERRGFGWWSDTFQEYVKYGKMSQTVGNVIGVVGAAFSIISSMILYGAVIFWILPTQMKTHSGNFSLPRFIAFTSAFGSFSGAFIGLFDTLIGIIRIIPLWERAKPIIVETPEVFSSKLKPGKITGEVRAEDIHFRYDENSPMVLNGVTIHVKPGEMIGFVGTSGCGKSTLVRILLGLMNPTKGNVYYNGKDINTVDLVELRRQVGTVMQDAAILQGSVYENIVCSGVYSPDDIQRAIEMSGFTEDLKDMPMGLHTVIPPGGASISGGQRQRLLIARALVGRPKVLIFDEATSALDNQTQDTVSKNLERLNVTRIVVAHRLSTIRNADTIYVFDKGKVIQSGSFDELAAVEGTFQTLLKRQKA